MKLLLSAMLVCSFIGISYCMEENTKKIIVAHKPNKTGIKPCPCGCSPDSHKIKEKNGIKKWHLRGISFLNKQNYAYANKERIDGNNFLYLGRIDIQEKGNVYGRDAKYLWYALKRAFNGKKQVKNNI